MTTKKILTLTLLATSLTLNAIVPEAITQHIQIQQKSTSSTVALTLFNRGIEKKQALKLSKALIGDDEELFSLMLHNYIHTSGFTQEEVYAQLSHLALSKQKADFSSYSFILKFTQSINVNAITPEKLQKFVSLSSKNRLLSKVFA